MEIWLSSLLWVSQSRLILIVISIKINPKNRKNNQLQHSLLSCQYFIVKGGHRV